MDANALGRYRLVREIARSNDVVYEATDATLGRKIALKELLLAPNLTGDAKRERIERFYREARAAGALVHRNIVTIFEVGDDRGRHFIAMEFLEGQTLRDVLRTGGALSLPRAGDVALQVLDALAYAHQNGVVHRDIKPDNIHLLPDGTVKLVDFGIARILAEPSVTVAGQVFGTASYMSPEQVAGRPVDARSDLFSMGIVLYEILAGQKPFSGDSIATITYGIVHQDPPPIPGLPPALAAVLRRALAKEPGQRYAGAADMASDLRAALAAPAASPYATITGAYPPTVFPYPPAAGVPPGRMPPGMGGPGAGTLAVRLRRRRRPLSAHERRLLLALAAGMLAGLMIVGTGAMVRTAYGHYMARIREQAEMHQFNAGVAAFNQGNSAAALDDFHQVMQRASGTPLAQRARDNIVSIYAHEGDRLLDSDPAQAARAYDQGLREAPDSGLLHAGLAYALERQGLYDQADAQWEAVLQYDPFGPDSPVARDKLSRDYLERGMIAFRQGNVTDARSDWYLAEQANPGSDAALNAEQMLTQTQND